MTYEKNCSNCYWNVAKKCESSDWKDGSAIKVGLPPACGYLTKNSTKPIGWKIKSQITTPMGVEYNPM